MRIAIDIRSLIEPQPSGISEYTNQVIKHLLSDNHEDEWMLFCNSSKREFIEYLESNKNINQMLRYWHWPNKLLNSVFFLDKFIKVDKVLGGVDVFFMPNINFISLSKNCKLILTIHDLSFTNSRYYSLKSRLWHILVYPKKLVDKADKIISVSQSTANNLQEIYGISSDKIEVIYSGVEKNKFLPVEQEKLNELKNRLDLPSKFFLFLGNVEKRKNILGIIQAWNLLKRRQSIEHGLVIAGKIIDKDLPNKFPRVKFLGYTKEEDKPTLYQLADAFIYPSFFEGFGLPVLEAMAAGCPVITSYATSLPEVAQHAAIIVDPYNINEISSAMKQYIDNTQVRSQNITNGLKVVNQFSWQSTAIKTKDLFNKI